MVVGWFTLGFSIALLIALLDVCTYSNRPPLSGKSEPITDISPYGFGPRKQLLVFDVDIDQIDLSDKIYVRMGWSDTSHPLEYGDAGIEIKGSGDRLQLNYAFEIWECENGECEDDKAELFEFGEDYEDWVLRGGLNDPTFVRDALASQLKGGVLQHTLVEVLFQRNDSYTYEGVYILYPAIQRRVLEKRLAWDEKGKAKCDNVDHAAMIGEYTHSFKGRRDPCEEFDLQVKMRYPKCDMDACLVNRTKHFFGALTMTNTTTVPIDLQSFVDTFYVESLLHDSDFPRGSQYFYVSPDGILHAGPRWDYDSMQWRTRDADSWDFYIPNQWQAAPLWVHLGNDATFLQQLEAQRVATVTENHHIAMSLLDARAQQFTNGDFARHLARWDPFGKQYLPMYQDAYAATNGGTKPDAARELQFIRAQFVERATWMNTTNITEFGFKPDSIIAVVVVRFLYIPILLACLVFVCIYYRNEHDYQTLPTRL